MQEIFSWACFNPTAMMHICHCSLAVGIRKNFRNRSYFGNFDSREVSRFSQNPPIPLLNPKTSQHVGRFLLFLPFVITLPDNTHGNRHFPVILVPFRFSLWPSSKVNLQVLFSFFVWLWILTQSFRTQGTVPEQWDSRGYRDSLLETAREAPTIWHQGVSR